MGLTVALIPALMKSLVQCMNSLVYMTDVYQSPSTTPHTTPSVGTSEMIAFSPETNTK